MKKKALLTLFLWVLLTLFVVADVGAQGIIEWEEVPPRTIVTDQYATYGMLISAAGGAGLPGPVAFDTSAPPEWDEDLGAPNDICDDGLPNGSAPGVGVGGETTNCLPLGNVLIVEQDTGDADGDGLIDGPPNDAVGGVITFTFASPVKVISTAFIDQEAEEAVFVNGYGADGSLTQSEVVNGLGDNSVQTISLNWQDIARLEVDFSGSGGVVHLAYTAPPTSVSLGDIQVQSDDLAGMPPIFWLLFAAIVTAILVVTVWWRAPWDD